MNFPKLKPKTIMVENHVQEDYCTGEVSVTFHPSSQEFYLYIGFSIYEKVLH